MVYLLCNSFALALPVHHLIYGVTFLSRLLQPSGAFLRYSCPGKALTLCSWGLFSWKVLCRNVTCLSLLPLAAVVLPWLSLFSSWEPPFFSYTMRTKYSGSQSFLLSWCLSYSLLWEGHSTSSCPALRAFYTFVIHLVGGLLSMAACHVFSLELIPLLFSHWVVSLWKNFFLRLLPPGHATLPSLVKPILPIVLGFVFFFFLQHLVFVFFLPIYRATTCVFKKHFLTGSCLSLCWSMLFLWACCCCFVVHQDYCLVISYG